MVENLSFAQRYEAYAGKTLGAYYLERLIEQLETGPVFLARQTSAQTTLRYRLRFLALPAELTPEERLLYLGHFQREAGQVAALQHAALLPLSDYGIFDGTPYLVAPDVASMALQSLVMQRGPLDTALASRYLDTLAAVLESMHQQGIFHLNVNARNVLLSQDGQPLLTEAGLVRVLAFGSSTSQRALALENGTPLLRDRQGKVLYGLSVASAPAPELLAGRPLTPASDVYALAALCYFLLTGHRALRGQTLADLAEQHMHAPVPSLANVPAELESLLRSALAKNPASRPRSPGVLANAWANIVAPGRSDRKAFVFPVASPALQPPQPQLPATSSAGSRTSSFSRRRALTLLAIGGGATVAAGVAVWALGHQGGSAAPVASAGNTPAGQSTPTSAQGTTKPAGPNTHPGKVLAHTADVPVNSASTFPIANSSNPGILIHLQNNHFVAFNSTCTHAGCGVAYNQQNHLLVCPCHGASFDPARNAAVVGGPAPSPLTAVAITVNSDGTITENS